MQDWEAVPGHPDGDSQGWALWPLAAATDDGGPGAAPAAGQAGAHGHDGRGSFGGRGMGDFGDDGRSWGSLAYQHHPSCHRNFQHSHGPGPLVPIVMPRAGLQPGWSGRAGQWGAPM